MKENEPGGEGRVQRVPKPQENNQGFECQGHDRRIRPTKYCDYIPLSQGRKEEIKFIFFSVLKTFKKII
jgi:hypothetical protein